MIADGCVCHIIRSHSRHVATDALRLCFVFPFRKKRLMAVEADLPDLLGSVSGGHMRIVASSTPKLAFAGASTSALCELLALTHRPHLTRRTGLQISHEDSFKTVTRLEIPPAFAGVKNSDFTLQVALLTNGIA